eukprot:1184860-Prorocentrum_minimum.AAC.2
MTGHEEAHGPHEPDGLAHPAVQRLRAHALHEGRQPRNVDAALVAQISCPAVQLSMLTSRFPVLRCDWACSLADSLSCGAIGPAYQQIPCPAVRLGLRTSRFPVLWCDWACSLADFLSCGAIGPAYQQIPCPA